MVDQRKDVIIYDLESYPNLFFVGCKKFTRATPTSEYKEVDTQVFFIDDSEDFSQYMRANLKCLWVSFNGKQYDDSMLIRYTNKDVFNPRETTDKVMRSLNDLIIHGITTAGVDKFVAPKSLFYFSEGKVRVSAKIRKAKWLPKCADLVDYSGAGSLKMKAIILNAPSIMESPVNFNDNIKSQQEIDDVVKYCIKDLDQTMLLYQSLENEFLVRDQFYHSLPEIAYGVNAPKLADEYFKMHTTEFSALKKSYWNKSIPAMDFLANKKIEFKDPLLSEWFDTFKDGNLDYPMEYLGGDAKFDFDGLITMNQPNHQFQFGTGGLHSTGKNGYWECNEDETIYNVDVKSYYPSMIVAYNINPAHTPNFSGQMDIILQDRFKVKQLGKETGEAKYKVEEQAKKLLMNSAFGKMKDKYSYLYDQKALHTVTITGQILLLKLIDMVISSGVKYELVNANTDGIFLKIKKKDDDKIKAVSRKWEKIAKVDLDAEYFTHWYQFSVNEYFAMQDTGYLKTKGSRCIYKPRLDQKIPISKIIKEACFEYLYNGIDPMITIKGSTNPTDFITSANSTDFLQVDTQKHIGYKAIRVVYSNSGSEFKALKNDNVNGGYKESVVLEGEKLKFLEILPPSVENLDLNYDKYCYEAWKQIYNIIRPRNDMNDLYYIPKREVGVVDWQHIRKAIKVLHQGGYVAKWADYLDSFGLSVIPKNVCKKNYKGIRAKQPDTWTRIDKRKGLGLGIITDNCCSIDIDNPANLDPTLKNLIEKYPTMKIFHGEDKVLNGGKGSFIYKTTDEVKLRSSAKMVENLGFEFLNDEGKVQTVFGIHPKGELYKIEGTPVELPNDIKEYLMGCKTPDDKRAIPRVTDTVKVKVVSNVLKVDKDLVVKVLEDNGISVKMSVVDEDSLQVWDDSHWFIVSRCQMTGNHYVNSNHSNFLNTLRSIFDGSF